MRQSVASETNLTGPYHHWKSRIQCWMDLIIQQGKTQSKNATKQQKHEISASLQFRMEDGAHPVLQRTRPLTNTAHLHTVGLTVKEGRGPIRYTISQVSVNGIRLATINARTTS